jgi:hypothetical protein
MGEILVGIFAILIGGLFALQGGSLMRLIFPLVGFFVGFLLALEWLVLLLAMAS